MHGKERERVERRGRGWKGEGEGGWEGGAWGHTKSGCMGVRCAVVEGSQKFTFHSSITLHIHVGIWWTEDHCMLL